jgi:hypothetical protein
MCWIAQHASLSWTCAIAKLQYWLNQRPNTRMNGAMPCPSVGPHLQCQNACQGLPQHVSLSGACPFDIMLGKREHVRMAQDFGQVEWDAARMQAPEKYEKAVFEERLLDMGTGLDKDREEEVRARSDAFCDGECDVDKGAFRDLLALSKTLSEPFEKMADGRGDVEEIDGVHVTVVDFDEVSVVSDGNKLAAEDIARAFDRAKRHALAMHAAKQAHPKRREREDGPGPRPREDALGSERKKPKPETIAEAGSPPDAFQEEVVEPPAPAGGPLGWRTVGQAVVPPNRKLNIGGMDEEIVRADKGESPLPVQVAAEPVPPDAGPKSLWHVAVPAHAPDDFVDISPGTPGWTTYAAQQWRSMEEREEAREKVRQVRAKQQVSAL